MGKFKKLSFLLIFACALLAGFSWLGVKPNKILNLEAASESITIDIKKVEYTNSQITNNGNVKKLGEYSAEELFANYDEIVNNSQTILSGEAVSINPSANQAVLVTLMPTDSSIIRFLTASLIVSTNGKQSNILVEPLKVSDSSENRIFIMAFDFTSLKTIGEDFDYSESAHLNFSFNYSYTTNGNNVISETKSADFFLVDENEYFKNDNKFKIDNFLKKEDGSEVYYYNKSLENSPVVYFNPNKFIPTINYSYNETSVDLTVLYENNEVKLNSSNKNIFESKTLTLDASGKAKIELNRIGEYHIQYNLAIKENENLTILDSSKTQNVSGLDSQTLYNFGYEALYKNYSEQDAEIKRLNQDYKPLFNNTFKSDFSYVPSFLTNGVPTIENIALELKNNPSLVSTIATTNQAPVKINSYVTENLSGAKYYILDKNYNYNIGGLNFSTSKRFEENGLYVVIIPYKFEIGSLSNQTFYKVIMFNIENSTPKIDFVSNLETESLINTSGFTNTDVFVIWKKESENPFSLPNKIKFVKNGEIFENYQVKTYKDKNYVEFLANLDHSNDGTYLVQLTYGTSEVTIEKQFTIDTKEIEFNVISIEKDNENNYIYNNLLSNSSSLLKTETDKSFAVFAKNKDVKNNTLKVKYDYVALKNVSSEQKYSFTPDGKLNIFNNYQLLDLYNNLTYSNTTLNNLTSFDGIYIDKNNSNAVLSISALYKFTISDLAGNTKTFFVLLDNTENIVLEVNDIVKIGENASGEKDLVIDGNSLSENALSEKSDNMSFVSNNYSLIFGDNKALEFKVTQNNANFAREYFSKKYFGESYIEPTISNSDNTIFYNQSILRKNEEISISRKSLNSISEEIVNNYGKIVSGNILNVSPDDNEIDIIFNVKSGKTIKQFELNTDRNRILIFGRKNDEYSRVFNSSATNSENLYITFIKNNKGDEFDLESLTLDFYPFIEDADGKIVFGNKESFDILSRSESGSISYNGVASGDYIVNPVVTTYQNGKYVSKEGKYVITKKYKNNTETSQTIYLDRKSAISFFSNRSEKLIGDNINITFDDISLSASTIYKYLLNNSQLVTNMLNFVWKNSDDKDFVYKYENLPSEDKENLKLNYVLVDAQNNIVNNNVLSKGDYTLIIYDNTLKNIFENVISIDNIRTSNFIELKIKVDTKAPQGFYVKDDNESLENKSSTNTNKLSFEFEDSESEFIYNIDINNIILRQNGKEIFRTTSTRQPLYFTLDGERVYYISTIGNVFGLSKVKIGDTNRYHYTLSILNPSKNSDALFNNGISLEAKYDLEISYNYNKDKYNLTDDNLDFGSNVISMIIDHTAPNKNFIKYLENDKFLTESEKETLKNSILNKDLSSDINFDNFVFIASNSPSFAAVDNNLPADIDNESNIDYTDTSNIYIRKYNKFSSDNIQNQQSLVIGDPRYSDQSISRYRFDINTYLDDKLLYSVKQYNEDIADFFKDGEGFYEIIEMDEAGNYTIYTVLYAPSQNINCEYVLDDDKTYQTESNETNLANAGFSLTKINISNFDFLNVKVSINENTENASVYNLRYLPFTSLDTNFEYFESLENLVSRINQIILSYADLNEYGNIYKIEISNRSEDKLIITNTTPNKEFEIVDFIKNYERSIVITVPNSSQNATFIKTLNVYPVINGKKGELLSQDSNGNKITLDKTTTSIFTFTNSIKINGEDKTVNVYYFEWIDNFNRVQRTVRYLGEKGESKFTFGPSDNGETAFFVTKNGENYTQYSSGVYFEFNPSLYSIAVNYQLLPSTVVQKLDILNVQSKLDLFEILNDESLKNVQVKFMITLTDLTKLDDNLPSNLQFSYIYYPLMPKLEFSDSSGNTLNITETISISTSKNVHLSYINDTPFEISSIMVTKVFENNTQSFNITTPSYTFSELGNYTVTITNELGKKVSYNFQITTATNQTYLIMTDEQNITNFEIPSYGITENLSFIENGNTTEQIFEVYYSIYKTKLVVNTDFKLSYEVLTPTDSSFSLYLIKQAGSVFKYVAVKNIDFNSNFLKFGEDESSFKIETTTHPSDITSNIKGYSLISTEGVKITLPLYNGDSNKIVVKIYYNNELIDLNANMYTSSEDIQTIVLDNVPSGVYSIYFEDYAGNNQLFNGNTFLQVAILNEIAVKINDEIPVQYQIYNNTVNLTILDERQYVSTQEHSITVQAWLNNTEITKIVRDTNRNYVFTKYGFYKVLITGYVSINAKLTPVERTLYFTILNSNEALKEFSFVSLNGQNISKILKDGKDVTNELKRISSLFPLYADEEGNFDIVKLEQLENLYKLSEDDFERTYLYNLNLSSEILYSTIIPDGEENTVKVESYDASGLYEIFVKTQNLILGETTYSFKVWIRDKNAKITINSTLAYGGETSKPITLSYNPYLIFTQIGECGIYLNDTLIAEINNSSVNALNNYTIPKDAKGVYIIQIKSSSGNTELSFVLNKTEPLSAVSIILIVVAVLIVAGGVFLFIKLRTRMKVK